MKKLSLLSLLGLAGLLAFFAAPIYAQEEDAALDEQIIAEAEDIAADVEDVAEDVAEEIADAGEAVEDVAEDVAEEIADAGEAVEDVAEDTAEEVDDFAALLESEEIQDAFGDFTKEETAWILWLFAGLWIAAWIVGLVWLILVIIAMWKIFTKAWEPGWLAIIPIVNAYIMYKIAGMKNWFWYTLIVAFVCWLIAGFLWQSDIAGYISIAASLFSGIVAIVDAYKLPRKFGWGVFASILYVLFTCICILILGFGNYKYQGKSETVVEA